MVLTASVYGLQDLVKQIIRKYNKQWPNICSYVWYVLIFFLQALSVATNAENQSKNGSDSVIPYDRNRVILTPDGARPHSTYINASFIEGYFNDESFIITQDPLKVNH